MASFDQHVFQRLLRAGAMEHTEGQADTSRRRRLGFGAGWISRLRDRRPVSDHSSPRHDGPDSRPGWSWSEQVAPFGVEGVRVHHHMLEASEQGGAQHCPAAGWGMIVSGSAILEIEPRKGEAQLRDLLRAGDVWSVPATANAWFHCCEDQAASVIAFIGGREADISDPGLCNSLAGDIQGGAGFHHRLMAQPALDRPWGSLRVVEADAFCDPDALSAALIEVSPGSQTDLHWHLNTAVWSICLEGEGSLTQVPAGISPQTTFLKPGQVGHVPRAEGYYLRNDGQTVLTVLEIFRSDHYHDLSLHEWLAASSVESIAAHLCVDVGMIARLSHAGETQGRLSTRL